jgi:hypothetical protein
MSKKMAILIETDGEITTANFPGLADADHPGGRLWHLRDLIDSTDPIGIVVPNSGLIAWLDGLAYQRKLNLNMVASFTFAGAMDLPVQAICGPLMVTGGSPEQPRPLTPLHVVKAMNRLGLRLYPNPALWLLQNTFGRSDASVQSEPHW